MSGTAPIPTTTPPPDAAGRGQAQAQAQGQPPQSGQAQGDAAHPGAVRGTGTVQTPPVALRALGVGASLNGVVVPQRATPGVQLPPLAIRTPEGVIDVATALRLPPGTAVTLTVQNAGKRFLVQLLAARLDSGAPAPTLTAGATMTAAVLPMPGAGTRLGTGAVAAAPGAASAGAPAGAASPAAASPAAVGASAAGSPAPSAAGPAAAGAAGPTGGAPITPAIGPQLAPGGRWSAQILAVRGAGEAPPPSQPGGLAGVVVGRTGASQPVVQTPQGLLALNVATDAPEGTQLLLRLGAPRPIGPPPSLPPPGRSAALLAGLANAFPEAEEMIQALAQSDPAALATLMQRMPQPNSRLTTNLLFFMVALRLGDAGRWLGGGQRDLEAAGRQDLSGRLTDRFADLARTADALRGQWQMYPTPFFDGERMTQFMLYVRDHGGGRGDEPDAAAGTRFVLEFSLSKFGPFQMDGLVKVKRFDLIIRSKIEIPDGLKVEAINLFEEANALFCLNGGVRFQTVEAFPVAPLEELAGERPGVLV